MADMTDFLMDRIKTLEAEKANYKGMILKMLNDVHPDSPCLNDFEIGQKWNEALEKITLPNKYTEVKPAKILPLDTVHNDLTLKELIREYDAYKEGHSILSRRASELEDKLRRTNKKMRQFGDTVRTVKIDGDLHFSLEDVCQMLGFSRNDQNITDRVKMRNFSYSHLESYNKNLMFISREDVEKLIVLSGKQPRSTLISKPSSELSPVMFLARSFFIDGRAYRDEYDE